MYSSILPILFSCPSLETPSAHLQVILRHDRPGGRLSTARSKSQIGCVVTYGSYRETLPPNPTGQAVGAGPGANAQGNNQGICVNPAALVAGHPTGPATANSYWAVEPPISATTKAPPRWS